MVRIHMAHDKTVDFSTKDDKYVVQRIGGGSIVDKKPVFSSDTKLLYVVYGHVVRAYSTKTGELVRDYKGLSHSAVGVQLHPTRPELVVALSERGEMMAWRWESGIHMMTVKLKVSDECQTFTGFHLLPSEDDACDVFATWKKIGDSRCYMSVFNSKGKLKGDLNLRFQPSSHGVSFAFGNYADGRYVAAISKKKLFTIDLKANRGNWFKLAGTRVFTCVACHPSQLCVATGDSTGRVLIWRDVIDNPQPPCAVYHWHTLPVNDIAFSQSGVFFYTGGGECTLVKWRLDSPHEKHFLPRLAAPVSHLSISKDNLLVSVSTQDNAIQLVDPQRKLTRTIQYFSWGVQSSGDDVPLFPAGLNHDRRTHSLVLNSRAGFIQFYDPRTHSLLYNLDITGQNYITQERHTKIVNTEVTRVALTSCGKWLASVDYLNAEEMSVQVNLKFYAFNETMQNYALHTSIEMPHQGRVYALHFQPTENQNDNLIAVTTGEDKRFRIWVLSREASNTWHCLSVGFYRDLPVRDASFSNDGSVLGVSFGPSLTLWNPENCSLQCSLSPAILSEPLPIQFIQFGNLECSHLVVAGTSESLSVWNILTLSMVWTVPLRLSILTKDPCSKYMAAFSTSNTLFVFAPSNSKPVFRQLDVCPSGTKILSAIFMPRPQPRNDSSWQAFSQLYFIDSNQELLAIQRAEEVADANELGLEGLPEWSPSLTPFSTLIAKQSSSAAVQHGENRQDQFGMPGIQELEEFISMPAHTMPPMHLLCGGLLGSLLASEKSPSDESSDKMTDEARVTEDEDSSDDENAKAVRPVGDSAVDELPRSTTDPEAERNLEEVLKESITWGRAVLA